jgi:ribosomal protein S18 acetylase RimI-like enzyme
MQIRLGTPDDVPHIRALTRQATDPSSFTTEACNILPDNDEIVERYIETASRAFEAALGKDNHHVFVATMDDVFLGYVIISHDPPEIDWIIVDTAAHGTGAAKALMMSALDALSDRQPGASVRLTVTAHNERAKAFYRKFGFLVTGPISGRDIPTIEMRRAA